MQINKWNKVFHKLERAFGKPNTVRAGGQESKPTE